MKYGNGAEPLVIDLDRQRDSIPPMFETGDHIVIVSRPAVWRKEFDPQRDLGAVRRAELRLQGGSPARLTVRFLRPQLVAQLAVKIRR